MVDDLTPDERALLECVPVGGATISNPVVQHSLGWSDERYWRARDALVDKGLIVRGRGRGGTLRRVSEVPVSDTVAVPVDVGRSHDPMATVEEAIKREIDLYEPMAAVIGRDWARDRRANLLSVDITALQGRRSTGGTWSRPDIVTVEIKTYAYVPGKYLEVITFEVKSTDSVDVQAVYESLAHRRAATHAYVLLHVPPLAATSLEEVIEDLRTVARSHGVGVITASDPGNYDTWEELEEAVRVDPSPDRLDQFIGTQLPERTRSKIARGLR